MQIRVGFTDLQFHGFAEAVILPRKIVVRQQMFVQTYIYIYLRPTKRNTSRDLSRTLNSTVFSFLFFFSLFVSKCFVYFCAPCVFYRIFLYIYKFSTNARRLERDQNGILELKN